MGPASINVQNVAVSNVSYLYHPFKPNIFGFVGHYASSLRMTPWALMHFLTFFGFIHFFISKKSIAYTFIKFTLSCSLFFIFFFFFPSFDETQLKSKLPTNNELIAPEDSPGCLVNVKVYKQAKLLAHEYFYTNFTQLGDLPGLIKAPPQSAVRRQRAAHPENHHIP